MSFSLSHILKQLPLEDTSNYRRLNKVLFKELNRTCIVIDDDPTGNQTVYDIPLLTSWDLETLIDEFKKETPVFFLLTNSRSLSQKKSSEVYQEISRNILEASKLINRAFTIISRSDSTLRGHFSEIDVIKNTLNFNDAITVFIPVMFEGNRVTVNDVHYISDGDDLLPVNETPFSQDHTFAYSKANLKEWIEEKTSGKISASDVFSLPIKTVRSKNTAWLSEQIKALKSGTFCISNALNYYDLDKITQALLLAEKSNKRIVYRTSSSFVPSYIGLEPKPLLTSEKIINSDGQTGGLTIVGSYVSKSSEQLNYTLNYYNENDIIEVNVETILKEDADLYLASIITKIDESIARGNDVIVYTSRKLITGKNADSNIDIASKVSDALVALVKGIGVYPKYILAKGGITSHDLALKGLGMKRSKVLGQIEPGVPVWEMGKETKFPKLLYIVFPGNVGNKKSLLTITQKLS
ncbi:four-carbon acid sugar kinase family protein [Flavivirga rizhaonensis]|uniref:Hydroxyacid dehydrogenase n=1 Tax=Flavivirga rizhaonensis TaxID=2559571 RepID=A0A4S1DXC6_9FLAO|nr:four-carbon acid sugar kinase family protein [Flavivirga rizhaonensis]TGV02593.1 hypothetical protein EM932_10490 [Flavivirga rizhaonensis]